MTKLEAVHHQAQRHVLQVSDQLLFFRYPLGDVDLISWPRPADEDLLEWQGKLALALYDAREMGYWDGQVIVLPNGAEFRPDDHLNDYTPPSAEGWLY